MLGSLSLVALAAAASAHDLHHGHHHNMQKRAEKQNKALVKPVYGGYTKQEKADWVYCPGDHMNWLDRNAPQWWQTDATQQDHVRFHALLSMAAYGDYEKECPSVFTQGFTVNEKFATSGNPVGQSGFVATIPEMNKVVLTYAGNNMDGLDWTLTDISDIVTDCSGCKAAKVVKDLYQAAAKATNNFATFKKQIDKTGLLSSVTGHGVGGAVAVLTTMVLGPQGYMQYSHNQGMPRAFNYESIVRFDRIVQAEASQSLVNANDPVVLQVPTSKGYCHVGVKIHITGDKDQWMTNCYGFNENTTCTGTGNGPSTDHTYYYTKLGSCGTKDKGF